MFEIFHVVQTIYLLRLLKKVFTTMKKTGTYEL